jgi:hypothetical protein
MMGEYECEVESESESVCGITCKCISACSSSLCPRNIRMESGTGGSALYYLGLVLRTLLLPSDPGISSPRPTKSQNIHQLCATPLLTALSRWMTSRALRIQHLIYAGTCRFDSAANSANSANSDSSASSSQLKSTQVTQVNPSQLTSQLKPTQFNTTQLNPTQPNSNKPNPSQLKPT